MAEERFEVLDALRGFAAIGVVLFHLSIVGAPQLAPHGYLAVDFFFMLSGFVLSHSYAVRLQSRRLTVSSFLQLRMKRLLPLSLLGLLLGTGYFLVRLAMQKYSQYGLSDILAGTAFNAALLPKPWVSQAPTDTTFPTNTPMWSLSFEIAVNVLWAALISRVTTKCAWVITAVTGGLLTLTILKSGTADLGATWTTFFGGAVRTLFGFFVGVLVWHYRPRPFLSTFPLLPMILLLATVFCFPIRSSVLDAVSIVLIFPLLMCLSVACHHRRKQRLLSELGRLSYPLYVVHVPILMSTVGLLKAIHLEQTASCYLFALVPICILVAIGLDKYYDRPIASVLGKQRVRSAL
ncbi:acyltransferase [Bradyrhizobium sp. B117]|uniref:acyltransferase family protein n=1 Tax=Bradyrhizobium sp. B117 TaxID=3140246 RepID=UPI003183F044